MCAIQHCVVGLYKSVGFAALDHGEPMEEYCLDPRYLTADRRSSVF